MSAGPETIDPCKAFFPADPDIAGIGIRISVYVTTALLALDTGLVQLGTGNGEAGAAFFGPVAGFQGLVLLLAAIVQTYLQQLSLYHAFIIFHMLSFLGAQLGSAHIRGPLSRSGVGLVIAVNMLFGLATVVGFFGWKIYMLSHAPTFGPVELRQCNERLLYVFFFKSVHATTKWLRIVLFIFGSMPLTITIPFFGPVFHAAYGITHLELMIRRNKFIVDEGEAGWGFGQVISMVLLVAPFKAILDFIACDIESDESIPKILSPGLLRSSVKLVSLLRQHLLRRTSDSQTTMTDEGDATQQGSVPLIFCSCANVMSAVGQIFSRNHTIEVDTWDEHEMVTLIRGGTVFRRSHYKGPLHLNPDSF